MLIDFIMYYYNKTGKQEVTKASDYKRLRKQFFHIIVGRIVKLVGQNFGLSISRSICSVSGPKFTNRFPIVGYFIQLVNQILPTGYKQ